MEEKQTFISYVDSIVVKKTQRKLSLLRILFNSVKPSGEFPSHPMKFVHTNSSLNLDKILFDTQWLGPKFCSSGYMNKQLDMVIEFENIFVQVTDLVPS